MKRSRRDIIEQNIARWRREKMRTSSSTNDQPFVVAIDAKSGARGPEVATLVAEILNLPLYGREIISKMAEAARVHESTVEVLDEMGQNHTEDLILGLMNEHAFGRNEYLNTLSRAVHDLVKNGDCVLLGHGAVHLVDRDHSITVELTGSDEARLEVIAEHEQLPAERAASLLRRRDQEHTKFHEQYFAPPVAGMTYDLVIDTSHLGVYASAALIVAAFTYETSYSEDPQNMHHACA